MIKRPISDNELKEHIASLAEDGREIFLLEGGKVRLTAVAATGMCNEMRANHNLGPLETYILGQGYVAGALLASTVKENDRIRLEIECGGPVLTMMSTGCSSRYFVRNLTDGLIQRHRGSGMKKFPRMKNRKRLRQRIKTIKNTGA